MRISKNRFDYTWVIVILSASIVFVSLGFCSSSKSIFLKAITSANNISRSAFSLNDSFRFITNSIVNMFFGTLIAKHGPKKLICAGLISLIASCYLFCVGHSLILFYLSGILLGLGLSWTTTTMVGYVINLWWKKENKGTVMGAVLATNGIGSAVATQIYSPLIHKSTYGYQNAYWVAVLCLATVLILILLFFKDKPNITSQSTPLTRKENTKKAWTGIEFQRAKRMPFFYLTLISVFFCGMMLQSVVGIVSPQMYDSGLDESYVAFLLSLYAIALTAFKFLIGYLYDKFGLKTVSNLCMVASITAFCLLANLSPGILGKTNAFIYCFVAPIALPLETVMLPFYANSLFGEKSYTKALGIITSVSAVGFALGAPVANLCYDLTNSYNLILYIFAGIMVILLIAMNYAIGTVDKLKKAD